MNSTAALPQLAFLGVGLMGGPMGLRLLQAGYAVHAWNRTRARTGALAEAGARIADSAEEAVRGADIIITMLESGPVVADVLEQAWAGLQRGAMVLEMSSTRQSEAQFMHGRLAQRGVAFMDAPVSGGVAGAQAGTLAIMVGGSAEEFARVAPLLRHLGQPTLVGPVGCGQLAKLCNQLIVGATLNIVAEALLLAQAGGADPAAVRAAIRGGFAESRILEVHGQRMLERNFVAGGQIKSQAKDMENILMAAAAADLHLPVTELVAQSYRSLLVSLPQADQAAALLALERLNPGKRLGAAADQFGAACQPL